MISLYVPKHLDYLDTEDNTSITITATSPLFDERFIQRTYSFEFSLPKTPKNNAILNHAYRLDDGSDPQSNPLSVIFYFNDQQLKLSLFIQSTTTVYRVVLKNDNRQLLKNLSQIQTKLLDYQLNIARFNNQPFPDAVIKIWTPTQVNLKITLNNKEYLALSNSTGAPDLINAVLSLRDAINVDYPGLAGVVQGAISTIRLILRYSNTTFRNIVLSTTNINGLEIVSNNPYGNYIAQSIRDYLAISTNREREDFVFPMIFAPNFYSKENNPIISRFNYLLNDMEDGILKLNTPNTAISYFDPVGNRTWENTLVPMPRIAFVLQQIFNKLDLNLKGEIVDNQDLYNAIIYYPIALDAINRELQGGPGDLPGYMNHFQHIVKLSDYIPDTKADEFIKLICDYFGLYYYVSGKNIFFKSLKNLVQKPVRNFTGKIIEGSITYNRAERSGITISQPDTKEPLKIATKLEKRIIGKGKNTYTLAFGTLHNRILERFMPHTDQYGTSKAIELENKKLQHRILFFKGNRTEGGKTYLYASNETENLSLDLNRPNNLYDKRLRGIIDLKNGEEFEFRAKITQNDFADFQNEKYSRIRASTPDGELYAYIKEIRYKLKNKTAEATVIAVKVNNF